MIQQKKTKMTSLGVRGRVWNDVIDFGGKGWVDRKFRDIFDDVIWENFGDIFDDVIGENSELKI
jgi:hypothetical protein